MMPQGAFSRGMILTCAILCGCVLDLIFADPARIPHPVVLMGKCISSMETWLRRVFPKSRGGELAGGMILAAALPVGVFAASSAFCALSWRIHPVLFFDPNIIDIATQERARHYEKKNGFRKLKNAFACGIVHPYRNGCGFS